MQWLILTYFGSLWCVDDPDPVLQWLFEVFLIHSTLMIFMVSDALRHSHSIIVPSLCFTLGTMFFIRLWLLSPNISSVSDTKDPEFCLIFPKATLPVFIIFFQVVPHILQSGMKVSLLQRFFLNLTIPSCAGFWWLSLLTSVSAFCCGVFRHI